MRQHQVNRSINQRRPSCRRQLIAHGNNSLAGIFIAQCTDQTILPAPTAIKSNKIRVALDQICHGLIGYVLVIKIDNGFQYCKL